MLLIEFYEILFQYSCKNFRLCIGFQFCGKVVGQLSQFFVKDFDGVVMKGEVFNLLILVIGEVDEDVQVNECSDVFKYFYLFSNYVM